METLLYASDTLDFALVAFKAPQASINCCVSFCKKTSSGSFLQFAPNVQVWADRGLKVGKCVDCGLDHVMVSLVPVLQAADEDQDVEILEPMMATPMKEDTVQFPGPDNQWTHSARYTLDKEAEIGFIHWSEGCGVGEEEMVTAAQVTGRWSGSQEEVEELEEDVLLSSTE